MRKTQLLYSLYPMWLKREATRLLNDHLIRYIKLEMRRHKFDPKIIDGTYVNVDVDMSTASVTWDIIVDYHTKDGFDVGSARIEGTRDHWVEPIRAKVLTWIYQAGQYASAIFFRGSAVPGQRMFSKGHFVHGMARTDVVERMVNRHGPEVELRLQVLTMDWFNRTWGSKGNAV